MVNKRKLSKRKKDYIGGDDGCTAKPEYFYDRPYYSDKCHLYGSS